MSVFGDYARYYDLLYGDKNYAAETEFVAGLLRRYAPAAETVLELGCGTGLHALGLAAAGYRVDGVDISDEMLAYAQHRRAGVGALADRVWFGPGDVRDVRRGRRYDAAVSLFHVMGYQTTDDDAARAIATAREHLSPGSPFIFDFWHGPAVLASGPSDRSKAVEDDAIRVVRHSAPDWDRTRNVVRVRYHVTVTDKKSGAEESFDEDHSVRYFFVPELADWLRAGGFRIEASGAWMTEEPPTEDTFSAYVVAIAV